LSAFARKSKMLLIFLCLFDKEQWIIRESRRWNQSPSSVPAQNCCRCTQTTNLCRRRCRRPATALTTSPRSAVRHLRRYMSARRRRAMRTHVFNLSARCRLRQTGRRRRGTTWLHRPLQHGDQPRRTANTISRRSDWFWLNGQIHFYVDFSVSEFSVSSSSTSSSDRQTSFKPSSWRLQMTIAVDLLYVQLSFSSWSVWRQC